MLLNGCASAYNKIEPENINYGSKTIEGNILLEYKDDLLEKKYKKKEIENNIKLIAVKPTNNSEKDIVLGINFKFVYEGGSDVRLMETENLYSAIKQSPATYLLYLLSTSMQLNTTTTSNGRVETTSSIPIGYGVGPGLAGGNMLAASNANKKF